MMISALQEIKQGVGKGFQGHGGGVMDGNSLRRWKMASGRDLKEETGDPWGCVRGRELHTKGHSMRGFCCGNGLAVGSRNGQETIWYIPGRRQL